MQARIVGIQRGARWLGEGWQLFRGAPLGWLAMVLAYWLLMTFASLLPLVGVVIAPVLVPAFSVGFMAAARAGGGGQRPQLALPFAGLRAAAHRRHALPCLRHLRRLALALSWRTPR